MKKVIQWFVMTISEIHWNHFQAWLNKGNYYRLTQDHHDEIKDLLSKNYMIILTRRSSHLTTYLTQIASWFFGNNAHYSHALMNVEDSVTVESDYKLIEATKIGVHYSEFMEVFDCDSVALLTPKGIPVEEWTAVLDKVKSQYGYPYDTLFDLSSDQEVTCVEMIFQGLKTLPNFEQRFPNLLKLLKEDGNRLQPQMMYDCGELEIAYEVRL